ncbi:hypothetical protein GN316_15820 [Xylophilus sp. Kf1]|nr:hypothetical protein [Xylophilus sp. Kf1]
MQQIIFISILMVGAMGLAFTMVATSVGTVQIAGRWSGGILPYFLYALFFSNSLITLLSDRDLSGLNLSDPATSTSPVLQWGIRLTSLFLMLASFDQCVRFFKTRPRIEAARALLTIAMLLMWLTNILAPAYWSTHPTGLSYNWLYQPILFIGLLCLTPEHARPIVGHARNTIFAFCLVSLVLVVVHPDSVIDTHYQKGIVAGWPRLTGLATHAVTMGMISACGIWCLLYAPYASRKLTAAGLLTCVAALLLSQSKNTWTGFLLGLPVLAYYRHRLAPHAPRRRFTVRLALVVFSAVSLMLAFLTVLFLGVADEQINRFTRSSQAAQLMSLTGRDIIWNIALDEWRRSPIFGYGLNLFDLSYRMQIGMLFATDGHNQLYDALARAGAVGAAGTIAYGCTLCWLGIRYSHASRGLSLILTISLMARTLTEVPFNLTVFNINDTAHYLLVCVLVSCMRQPATRIAWQPPARSPGFSTRPTTC